MFTTVNETSWGPVHVSTPDLTTVNWSALGIVAIAAILIFRFKMATLKVLGICSALGLVAAYLIT